jgi:hypothetical protein
MLGYNWCQYTIKQDDDQCHFFSSSRLVCRLFFRQEKNKVQTDNDIYIKSLVR